MVTTLLKSTLREIRQSLGRYLAILAIIALGVGFFAGLRMSQPAMIETGAVYIEEYGFHDFRLMSTLGFTTEDVQAFADLDGVDVARGSVYAEFLWQKTEEEQVVLLSHMLTEGVNEPKLVVGRMPEKANECLGDANYFTAADLGRTIQVSSNNEEDTLDLLTHDEYTLVGLADTPLYLNYERGTAGIGNGNVSAFLLMPEDSFDSDAFYEIYLRLEDAAEAYSDAYQAQVDEHKPLIEQLLEQRAEIRYDTLYSDAMEEIRDGEKELSDGWEEYRTERADAEQELADALQELTDGEKEYADGLADYEQGKLDYADGLAELVDARQEIADAKQELADAEQEVADAAQELADGWEEYETAKADAEKQLADAKAELESGEQEYRDGLKECEDGATMLREGREEITAAAEQLASAEKQLNDSKAELDAAKSQLHESKVQLDYLENQLNQMPPEMDGYDQLSAQYQSGMAAYNAGLIQYEQGLMQYQSGMMQLQEGQKEITAANEELDAVQKELKAARKQLRAARLELDEGWAEYEKAKAEAEQELADALQKLLDGERELAEGRQKLADARKKLSDGERELADGERELADAKEELDRAPGELADARKELDDGWAEYYDGLAEADEEFAEAEQELRDGEQEIADAYDELSDLKQADTYTLTRKENNGYACFENDTSIIAAISVVFPVFFFLVAALVCMTTMKRMVDEQRTQIGVLKALGYSRGQVIGKYLFYSGSAAMAGCLLGYALGSRGLPLVIWEIYGIMYGFASLEPVFDPVLAAVSFAAALLCSMGATFLSCYVELARPAAELIRPKTPKAGKRVFLEYITPVWKRLGFLHKVSIRNVLRYRSRLVMMILGIGGCTALLVTGFGLRDSIANIAEEQYDKITLYDYAVNFQDPKTQTEADSFLAELGWTADMGVLVHSSSIDVFSDTDSRSTYLVIPAENSLEGYISLHSGDRQIAFPGVGEVVLNVGLAEALSVTVGDTISIRDDDLGTVTVTVVDICENYIFNYIFVAPETWQQQVGSVPDYKTLFVLAHPEADPYEEGVRLAEGDGISNVTVNAADRARVSGMLSRMDILIVVVVVCAGALAFIVLFNLTNINITERIREIATIKVLGFYRNEVAAYVFREITILSAAGSLVGLLMGKALHAFVMAQVKVDGMFFPSQIKGFSYLISLALTMLFTVLITRSMRPRLQKIDMAESLKSIE